MILKNDVINTFAYGKDPPHVVKIGKRYEASVIEPWQGRIHYLYKPKSTRMTTLLNYTAWFNLFALALNLVNDPIFQEQLELKTRWGDINAFELESVEGSMALYIDVVSKESNKTILSFALIPWQEMSSKEMPANTDKLTPFPNYQLYTVTPFAVIYRIDPHERNKSDTQLAEKACTSLDHFFNYEGCRTLINTRDAYTSGKSIQVIEYNEYPWYVDIWIAVPGSNTSDIKSLVEEFGCRMIRLNLVPKIGIAQTRWLVSSESPLGIDGENAESALLPLFRQALESCISDKSPEQRQQAYDKTYIALKKVLDHAKIYCDSMEDFYVGLLERLLFYDPAGDLPFDPKDPFPDFVPKMTPDELLDFMPELNDEFANLPPAEKEQLSELILQYKIYRKAARKKPGKWIEGNPVLGGKRNEYQPGREELVLSEIGERIRQIVEEEGSNGIKAIMKEQKAKKKWIKYIKFTFTHMDVMGSGRYFYVENMEKVNLKLY